MHLHLRLVVRRKSNEAHAMTTFSEVVDAADGLSLNEQETLVEILRRRIARRKRDALVRDVAEARAEFQSGPARTTSVSDIMEEVGGAP